MLRQVTVINCISPTVTIITIENGKLFKATFYVLLIINGIFKESC